MESLMDKPVFGVEKITGKFVLVDKVHILGYEVVVGGVMLTHIQLLRNKELHVLPLWRSAINW